MKFFKRLFVKKEKIKIPQEPRMYLILREDLAFKYIQGAHGLAQFSLLYPDEFKKWNNQYLICLSVFNGLELEKVRLMLIDKGVSFAYFIEPDLESKLPTAIAFFDDGNNSYRDYVSHLRMATK